MCTSIIDKFDESNQLDNLTHLTIENQSEKSSLSVDTVKVFKSDTDMCEELKQIQLAETRGLVSSTSSEAVMHNKHEEKHDTQAEGSGLIKDSQETEHKYLKSKETVENIIGDKTKVLTNEDFNAFSEPLTSTIKQVESKSNEPESPLDSTNIVSTKTMSVSKTDTENFEELKHLKQSEKSGLVTIPSSEAEMHIKHEEKYQIQAENSDLIKDSQKTEENHLKSEETSEKISRVKTNVVLNEDSKAISEILKSTIKQVESISKEQEVKGENLGSSEQNKLNKSQDKNTKLSVVETDKEQTDNAKSMTVDESEKQIKDDHEGIKQKFKSREDVEQSDEKINSQKSNTAPSSQKTKISCKEEKINEDKVCSLKEDGTIKIQVEEIGSHEVEPEKERKLAITELAKAVKGTIKVTSQEIQKNDIQSKQNVEESDQSISFQNDENISTMCTSAVGTDTKMEQVLSETESKFLVSKNVTEAGEQVKEKLSSQTFKAEPEIHNKTTSNRKESVNPIEEHFLEEHKLLDVDDPDQKNTQSVELENVEQDILNSQNKRDIMMNTGIISSDQKKTGKNEMPSSTLVIKKGQDLEQEKSGIQNIDKNNKPDCEKKTEGLIKVQESSEEMNKNLVSIILKKEGDIRLKEQEIDTKHTTITYDEAETKLEDTSDTDKQIKVNDLSKPVEIPKLIEENSIKVVSEQNKSDNHEKETKPKEENSASLKVEVTQLPTEIKSVEDTKKTPLNVEIQKTPIENKVNESKNNEISKTLKSNDNPTSNHRESSQVFAENDEAKKVSGHKEEISIEDDKISVQTGNKNKLDDITKRTKLGDQSNEPIEAEEKNIVEQKSFEEKPNSKLNIKMEENPSPNSNNIKLDESKTNIMSEILHLEEPLLEGKESSSQDITKNDEVILDNLKSFEEKEPIGNSNIDTQNSEDLFTNITDLKKTKNLGENQNFEITTKKSYEKQPKLSIEGSHSEKEKDLSHIVDKRESNNSKKIKEKDEIKQENSNKKEELKNSVTKPKIKEEDLSGTVGLEQKVDQYGLIKSAVEKDIEPTKNRNVDKKAYKITEEDKYKQVCDEKTTEKAKIINNKETVTEINKKLSNEDKITTELNKKYSKIEIDNSYEKLGSKYKIQREFNECEQINIGSKFKKEYEYFKSDQKTSSESFTSKNKERELVFDESSTSDYSSESHSYSETNRRRQSFDSKQRFLERQSNKNRNDSVESLSYDRSSLISKQQSESKPVFCGRLVDRTASQGSKVRVTCSLAGSPEPTVHWYRDGLPISNDKDPRFKTRLSNGLSSLEINDAKLGDSGRYTCVARNCLGEANTTANIKIYSYFEPAPEAPVFVQLITDAYRSAKDELVVECRVKGYPQPTVKWLKDGVPLPARTRYEQSVLADGTCRLTVHSPEPADSGLYKCVAENNIWSEQTSGFVVFEGREKHLAEVRGLTETKLPRFTNIVSDHVIREGGTVALQVAVKAGTPRADVTWYRDSEPLPKKSSRFRYLEDAGSGVYSLVLSETSRAEAGTYTCRASNSHGQREASVTVQVVGGAWDGVRRGKTAMFLSRPDTRLCVANGEDISVSFRVSGDPKPRITWMKGIKDITTNIRTLKETVNDYVRLTLKHATIMDAGTYFIQARNMHGADHAFFTVKVRQRARSLTPTGCRSFYSCSDTSTILRDIHQSTQALIKDVPGPITGEATVSDSGKNWVSLTWSKPENRGAAPVVAYRVEAWRLGSEGGAAWIELGVTPINSFDAFFLKPGAEYKFRITPRNRYGWGESVTNTQVITVGSASNFPPEIVKDLPGPFKALQGSDITLECEVAGDPQPDVEWLKDGQDIASVVSLKGRVFVSHSQQLTPQLTLKQLTDEDSGRYVCEAVNKLGRASTYARLLVVSDARLLEADRNLKENVSGNGEIAPQFTMRLRDRRVQETYPVRLSCQVIGNPAPTISWAHEDLTITNDDRHQLLSEADHFYTLEMSRAMLEDCGEYTVTAQNCLGAVKCRCQLTVDKGIRAYISPDFTAELQPAIAVKAGAELRLFAQVEAYPSVGIAWQRDGVRLRPSRRVIVSVDPEGRVELSVASVTSRDAGMYTCVATNVVGHAQTSCQVTVMGSSSSASLALDLPTIVSSTVPYSKEPRFVTKPRSSEAVEGETLVIDCDVVGDPKPEVMWLRDWLKPGYYRDAAQFRQVGGGGSGTQYSLEIPQVKLDFTGTYCVIARNEHGEAKAIISVQIYAKGQGKETSMVSGQVKHGKVETLPEIKRDLRDVRCCDGDSATLECLVLATPPPSVRWEKDGKILPLGEDIEAEVEGEVARLTIKRVYPEDEGQYSCVAYNELGRAITTACLVVDVPEEKETLLSQQLIRPPGLLGSTRSTPRSTPRQTPSPSPVRGLSPVPSRFREFSSPSSSRPKRIKMSSPKFYTVPHNRIAEEGETVRFQCAVAGHPTPWASWDKDGHIVSPSARLSVSERDDLRTLELREVTVDDAGLYRVSLENEMGSVEATARLDVIGRRGSRSRSVRAWSGTRASPTFGRRLIGSAARVGSNFTLSCDVSASPAPTTTWYRNGEMLVMTERVIPSWDGKRAQLELRYLHSEDNGVYTCVAGNAYGTSQCSAELSVLASSGEHEQLLQPPMFTQGLPAVTSALEGHPLELQTRIEGSGPLEVVWVKDGVEIPDCDDFRYVDYGDGRFGLRVADAFTADSGTYNCEVFNSCGDAITSGHLVVSDMCTQQVSEEPEICFTKSPSPVLAPLRGKASFCARLQSGPAALSHAVFTWTVNGQVSSQDDRFTVETEGDCSMLHISEVGPNDAGPVMCTARVCSPGVPPTTVSCTSELSLDTTTTLTPVAATVPACLLRGPSDTTAMRGDRVLLKAIYRGTPEPTVRWLKAGRELTSEGRVQINSRDGVSCLTIAAITADDSGKYIVCVENLQGNDCHFASVAVEGPPEPPAVRPSVSRGETGMTVTVAWSSPPYDGGCVLTGYRLEMRTADCQEWSVVADRCHSLSHTVQNLNPGATYVFRVRAENIHGVSETSTESFPFTFTLEPPGPIEDDSERCEEEVLEERSVSLESGEQFTQRYTVHEELGKGRYGVVHKVTDLLMGHTLAAKFIRCIKKQDREKVQEEIDIMNCLRHPKLLQLTAAFDNPREIVMVMEYISGGELFERVVADDFTLTERDCILFLRQICEGVRYMHQCQVVHLDLKPENIMCHTRTSHRIKIIDFGLAQKLASNTPVRVLFGTPEFIPPEIINYEPIGVDTDMWSVGVICYVLLSGLSPFMGDNDAETFANITRADYDFDDEAFDAISQDAKDFISALLIKRKEKRLTAEECLQHKWLTQCDMTMSCVKLSTDKLKKFIIRRKWQPRNDRQIA